MDCRQRRGKLQGEKGLQNRLIANAASFRAIATQPKLNAGVSRKSWASATAERWMRSARMVLDIPLLPLSERAS